MNRKELEEYYNRNQHIILPVAAGVGTFGAVAGYRYMAPKVKALNKKVYLEMQQDAIVRGRQAGREAAESAINARKAKSAGMALKIADNLNQASRPLRRQLPNDPEFKRGVQDGRIYKKPRQRNLKYQLGFYKGHMTKSAKYDYEPIDVAPAVGGGAAYLLNRKNPKWTLPAKGAVMAAGIGTGAIARGVLRKSLPADKPLINKETYDKIRAKDHWSQKVLPGFIRQKQLETERFSYGKQAFEDKYLKSNYSHNLSDETRKYYKLKGVKPTYAGN